MPTDRDIGSRRPLLFADSNDKFITGDVKVYARVAIERPMMAKDLWYQYWIWYPNDRDHEGDWELVQLKIDTITLLPLEAVYAQHRSGERRAWVEVTKSDGRPHVYVERDKHASLFSPGWHRHGWRIEKANGRRSLHYTFRIIDSADARELSRPGRWGDDDDSPLSPGRQLAWSSPTTWTNRIPIARW